MYAYKELSPAGSKTHIMLKIRPVGQGISPFLRWKNMNILGNNPGSFGILSNQ
jgi:hypothetical protein